MSLLTKIDEIIQVNFTMISSISVVFIPVVTLPASYLKFEILTVLKFEQYSQLARKPVKSLEFISV